MMRKSPPTNDKRIEDSQVPADLTTEPVSSAEPGLSAKPSEASQETTLLFDDDPQISALFCEAVHHRQFGRLDRAMTCLERILKERPGSPPTLNQKGLILLGQNRLNEAEACFQKVLAQHPEDPYTNRLLGLLYLERDDIERALGCYARGLNADPYDTHVLFELGSTHQRSGDSAQARRYFHDAVRSRQLGRRLVSIKRKVLVINRDDRIRNLRGEEALTKYGYDVQVADPQKARTYVKDESFPVVITDLSADEVGFEVVEEARKKDPLTMVIITGTERADIPGAGHIRAFAHIEMGGQQTGRELLDQVERAYIEYQHRIRQEETRTVELETRKGMLSFLTHTIRSAFVGAPAALDLALRQSGQLMSDFSNNKIYNTINSLAYLRTSFAFIGNMVNTFKILIRDPEEFRESWFSDRAGEFTPRDLVADILCSAFGQLLFQEAQLAPFRRHAEATARSDLKQIQQSFLGQVLLSEAGAGEVFSWMESEFPIMLTSIDNSEILFKKSGIRYNFLFACLSELIFNAIKYSDGLEPISLVWNCEASFCKILCENTFTHNSRRETGSRMGLGFIDNLLSLLANEATLSLVDHESRFSAQLQLKQTVLKGERNHENSVD